MDQQHHINNNNNNDDDDDSTVLTTSVDTTTTITTITITNEVEVVVEQTTNDDDGGTNNNTNEHAEEEKVPLPSPDISVVTTSHNNDASPNEDVVVDTNETSSSSSTTTENESQDDTSQQQQEKQAVLIKEKPRASPRLSIFSNLFTNNNNNKNANHNDIVNRSNSLPTTHNSNNNNNNNNSSNSNSNNNNYRFSAVFSRGNNNNIHRGSLPALPSNYHVHGDVNNAKTVRKSFFSTQKSFKKQQQQQQQQSSISDDVALASALIDDFDEQNKVNHMDQQQQSTTESVMERDGNDVHVCIGSRTLPQLKHILKTDQKFGYLTVDQFLEFGLRYGFSHESFIVIFTTTYKTFMTARQVIPRLQFVLDRLVQQQKTKQEEELSLHNRLSSDSSNDDEKNNDGEDEKNEAKMTAVNSEEQQNRLIVLGKEKQNRMIQRVSLFVQKWIIDCQTDLMFDRNMIGDLYSFIGGLGSYVCTIDEGEEAIDAETSSTLFTQNIVFDLAEVSGKILTKFQQQNAASSVGNGGDSGDSFGSSGGGLSVGSLGDSSMMGMVSNSGVGMGDGMDDSLSAQERYEELMKSAPKPYYLSREPKDARLINILDLNPIEIARQLTISEFGIFQKITGEELLALGWNKSSKEWTAPNISEIISRSNMMTDWVATLILRVENIKERAKLLKHFINVADACLKINNFNTLFEIMMALISNPVHRLKKTWEAIGAPDRMKFKKLEDVCSFSSNRKNYREELKKVSPTQSCLPYLGVSLTDLVFFDEGNKSTKKTTEKDANVTVNNTGEGTPREITDDIVRSYINFTKKSSMAGVVRGLMNFKSRPYALTPVPYMQLFLYYSMNSNIISSEEELDRLSNLREEPRRGASSKVS